MVNTTRQLRRGHVLAKKPIYLQNDTFWKDPQGELKKIALNDPESMWNRSYRDMDKGPRRVGKYIPWYTKQYIHEEPSWNNLTLGYRLRRGGYYLHDPWYKAFLPFTYWIENHYGQDPRVYGWYNPLKYYNFGRLDWKNHVFKQTPAHLVADNWKAVTEEESRAHAERQEIMGRNRRYYWKMELHPKYGETHFHFSCSDAQWIRHNRAFMQMFQMFMKGHAHAGTRMRWHLILWIIPCIAGYLLGMLYYTDGERYPHWAPVINKYGANPHAYYFQGHTPYNAITHDNGPISFLINALWSSMDNVDEMYSFRNSKMNAMSKGEGVDDKWELRTKNIPKNDNMMRRLDGRSGYVDPDFFKDGLD